MTWNEDNICNVKIHIKQCLNELKRIDELMKVTTNDKTATPIWLSQYDIMNLLNTMKDFQRNGFIRRMWEENVHGEKHMQNVKNEFTSKRKDLVKH